MAELPGSGVLPLHHAISPSFWEWQAFRERTLFRGQGARVRLELSLAVFLWTQLGMWFPGRARACHFNTPSAGGLLQRGWSAGRVGGAAKETEARQSWGSAAHKPRSVWRQPTSTQQTDTRHLKGSTLEFSLESRCLGLQEQVRRYPEVSTAGRAPEMAEGCGSLSNDGVSVWLVWAWDTFTKSVMLV